MRKLLLVSFVVLCAVAGNAQGTTIKDSLQRLLQTATDDTTKIKLLLSIGEQYENTEPETAKSFYREVLQLSKKNQYVQGELKYAAYYSGVLNMQGVFDSSLLINLNALQLAKKINDTLAVTKAGFNTATSYTHLGKYDSALYYYFKVLPYIEAQNNERMLAIAYNNLQSVYRQLSQYQKAIEYGKKALQILRRIQDPITLSYTSSNLGTNYASMGELDSALIFYNEAYVISNTLGDDYSGSTLLLNIGDIDYKQGNYEAAKQKFTTALNIARQLQLHETETIATKGIGSCWLLLGNFAAAKQYADSAFALTYQYNNRKQRLKVYNLLEDISYASRNYKMADNYSLQYDILNDSINADNLAEVNARYEKEYDTKKKETQLLLQQSQLKQKNTLNYWLTTLAIALLLVSLLMYRNYKHRQKLQQAKIEELQTQQQLTATAAVLKGEEQERSRLAKDLHDGLGGMLSGIKHSLGNMKENLIMTPDNAQAFERSIDMLDSSIKEMRRVAHNMMPEIILRYGLDTALKEHSRELNSSGVLRSTYQSIGITDTTTSQTTAVAVYRIVQELANNAIKHAAASNLLVQVHLVAAEKLITLTVEDDGKGFDTALLNQQSGMGWSNIKNRVEFLKGKLDIHSAPDKGTSVFIEIPI